MKPTYPDGREIREKDVVHDGTGIDIVERIEDGKLRCRDGFDYLDSLEGYTLLRRRNVFKVGDEVRHVPSTMSGNIIRVLKSGYVSIRGVDDYYDPADLTLITPVESIEGGEIKTAEAPWDAIPDWQRRAESKDFEAGDVVVHRKGMVQTVVRVHDLEIECTNGHAGGFYKRGYHSLLRPNDWAPQVGDRVVCIESFGAWSIGGSCSCDVGWWVQTRQSRFAPSELAEPLLPLLRGKGMSNDRAMEIAEKCAEIDRLEREQSKSPLPIPLHPCPRHESTGCKGSIESGECDACGWPGMRDLSPPDVWIPDTCDRGMMDKRGDEWTGSDFARGGIGSFEPGETIPQRALRSRWTADFPRTTKHCRLCGRDDGCGCGKEYC